jgi:GT2 family glycosyltransferase
MSSSKVNQAEKSPMAPTDCAEAVAEEADVAQGRPVVTIVIPSLDGETAELERRLGAQTWRADQIEVVRGVRPNGLARNVGVAATNGEILVFIDDDALPGQANLVEELVRPLLQDPTIGVTGAARVLPPDAPWFQRRVAAEIPRTVNAVPEEPLETNPPLEGYGHSLITTTCAAMRRSLFEEAGRFDNVLSSGVDTDLFYRIRSRGYRFVMVPHVYVEHPAPGNLRALMRKLYWYGLGHAEEVLQRPQQHMGFKLPTALHRLVFLLAATLWLVPNIFILYSYGYPHWRLGFRPLKALGTYAAAWGYAYTWGKRRST